MTVSTPAQLRAKATYRAKQLALRTAQAKRVEELEDALRPFAACADELDGSEDVPRAPDGEWAKFRLLTDDYRRARQALEGNAKP